MRNLICGIVLILTSLPAIAFPGTPTWLKGNTHTHTFESDGDSPAQEVVDWYDAHGYDFLVITDHDRITCVGNERLTLIPGEEVTDRLERKSLHVNAIGLRTMVKPQHGSTSVETLQNDIDAVRAAGGLAAINHPNFGWAFGSRELLQLRDATLLEIASGHPYVSMNGPPSVESMWDELLTAGVRIWGIAVDDSHHLTRAGDSDTAPPGKGWIVVRTTNRSPAGITDAIRTGDFYASTGVELADYHADRQSMRIEVIAKNLSHYRVQLIGTGGRLLEETDSNPATFLIGDRCGYVRARIVDSNGKMAWMQPAFLSDPSRCNEPGAATSAH